MTEAEACSSGNWARFLPSGLGSVPLPKRRRGYEWLLEWGVIDHRHEQAILRWERIRSAEKPPLCHFRRVLHREIPFGYLFNITLKSNIVEPGYSLDFLAGLCREPSYGAHIRETCERITDIIRRFETPAPLDEVRPLYRWLLHWAWLCPRDEWAIGHYIEAQADPCSPQRIWLDLLLPAEKHARLRALLVSTTEAAALAVTQQEEWSRLRFAPDAVATLLHYFEEGWPDQPPYTHEGETPFLLRPRAEQAERLAAIREDERRWNEGGE